MNIPWGHGPYGPKHHALEEKISHSMGSTTIRMNLVPLKVELSYNGSTMVVNKEYKLTCRAYGSKPAAVITWWIDGTRIPQQNYITVHTTLNRIHELTTLIDINRNI